MEERDNRTTVCFSGGGTLGPIVPLLAMQDMIMAHRPETRCFWIATQDGPEHAFFAGEHITPYTIPSVKFHRYLTIKNILDVYKFFTGFFVSLKRLHKEKPTVCITAGGFVSVPVHLAAKVLGIRTWVHQQDREVGLANKVMASFADCVTVALKEHMNDFSTAVTWIGNPVTAPGEHDAESLKSQLDIPEGKRVLLVFGGGTGSKHISEVLGEAATSLPGEWFVVHITGKHGESVQDAFGDNAAMRYVTLPVVTRKQMSALYTISDAIVCRAGFSTITEITAHKKRAILVPLAGHQEKNASLFPEVECVQVIKDAKFSVRTFLHALATVSTAEFKEEAYSWLPHPSGSVVTALLDSLQDPT